MVDENIEVDFSAIDTAWSLDLDLGAKCVCKSIKKDRVSRLRCGCRLNVTNIRTHSALPIDVIYHRVEGHLSLILVYLTSLSLNSMLMHKALPFSLSVHILPRL